MPHPWFGWESIRPEAHPVAPRSPGDCWWPPGPGSRLPLPGETKAAPQVNDVAVYSDELADGWVHIAGWNCTYNYANPTPTHTGDASIALTLDGWGGISVWHPDDFPADDYATLEF